MKKSLIALSVLLLLAGCTNLSKTNPNHKPAPVAKKQSAEAKAEGIREEEEFSKNIPRFNETPYGMYRYLKKHSKGEFKYDKSTKDVTVIDKEQNYQMDMLQRGGKVSLVRIELTDVKQENISSAIYEHIQFVVESLHLSYEQAKVKQLFKSDLTKRDKEKRSLGPDQRPFQLFTNYKMSIEGQYDHRFLTTPSSIYIFIEPLKTAAPKK